MTGESPTNTPETSSEDGFLPETADDFRERLRVTAQSGTTQSFHEELHLRHRTVWTQALYTPFPSTTPGNTWVSIAAFDVTEQKLRELATQAMHEQIIEQQTMSLNELPRHCCRSAIM